MSYGTALSGSSGQTSEIEVPCGLSWDTLSSEIPALYASLATEIDLFIKDGKFVNPFTKAINKQDLYEIMAERGVTFNLLPALYKLFNSCSQLTEHEVVRRIATLESTFQALCFFQGLTLFGPLVYDEISETMRLERGAYQGRQEAALTSITNLLSGLTQSRILQQYLWRSPSRYGVYYPRAKEAYRRPSGSTLPYDTLSGPRGSTGPFHCPFQTRGDHHRR